MHRCCRPLYLNNCTSWFMGFREVLCVPVAAARGYGGLAFSTINIQGDSHLEPRPALLRFGFIYLFLLFI